MKRYFLLLIIIFFLCTGFLPRGQQTSFWSGIKEITTGGTNAKGSWVELHSGYTVDIHGFELWSRWGDTSCYFLCDVGIGASGSEVVILEDVAFDRGDSGAWRHAERMRVPLFIPKGQRIAFRCQSSCSAKTISLGLQLPYGGFDTVRTYKRSWTRGENNGDSRGTTTNPGGTAWVNSAWVSVGTTPEKIRAVVLGFVHEGGSSGNGKWNCSLRWGDDDNNICIQDAQTAVKYSYVDTTYPAFSEIFPCDIPWNQDIDVRCKTSNTGSQNNMDIIVYLFE